VLKLNAWPADARRRITGVFTDIDDTLTTDGAITPDALQALAQDSPGRETDIANLPICRPGVRAD